MSIKKLTDLGEAAEGSYYTILGTGGDLDEWVEGYEKLLADEGIGKPIQWYQTTGAAINKHKVRAFGGGRLHENDGFQDDLAALLFPLDGLDVGKLAIFKLQMRDRWFDDVIDNMRVM